MKSTYKTRTEIQDGKRVKVVKASKNHDTDRTNINNNAIDRDNRTSNNIVVPVW